jgi:uncharacterized cupin superfamily protein
VEVFNLNDARVDRDDDDPPGYDAGYKRIGDLVGGAMLGATLYELAPGNSNCPYHYEYGAEEWLLCVAGVVTIRTPDGEVELRAGDVICFREGPDGAHKVTNNGGAATRVLIWSTKGHPNAAVYPDSGKIGLWPASGSPDQIMVRRESNVDYWDGEI